MRVHFHHFWPGFLEGTNPNTVAFFVELFRQVFDEPIQVENNPDQADVLCENACKKEESLLYHKSWKYSILVTGESVVSFGPFSNHYDEFSCFLSGLAPSIYKKRVKFPLLASYLYCNRYKSLDPVRTVPPNTVCAVIANPHGKVRNAFLDRLEKHMPVTYGGSFRNNIGYCVQGDHNSDDLIEFMRRFKFVITMENNQEDYYLTEKICNGLFAGIIPVYWGSPHVHEYIHSERFLYVANDSEEEMDRVIHRMLHMTDDEYMTMVESTIFMNEDMIGQIAEDMKQVLYGNQ